jgi:hypothetical protein
VKSIFAKKKGNETPVIAGYEKMWFARRKSLRTLITEKNAANPFGVLDSDGGHERSRTSDPYSVKE